MKRFIGICFFWIWLGGTDVYSQNKTEYFSLPDSIVNIPNLAIHTNVCLVFLSLYSSAWTLGYTGQQYFINEKKYNNAKYLKPYFISLNDEVATNYFRLFETSKNTAKICGGLGLASYFIGYATSLSQIAKVNSNRNNGTIIGLLLVGTGLVISAPIIKLRGISKLKIAMARHNSFR